MSEQETKHAQNIEKALRRLSKAFCKEYDTGQPLQYEPGELEYLTRSAADIIKALRSKQR